MANKRYQKKIISYNEYSSDFIAAGEIIYEY